MKNILFIINPFAGQKKGSKHLSDMLLELSKAGLDPIVHMTTEQGDAIAAAEKYAKDVDLVICCGGDGTLNETITGILQAGADTPIGYIPAGTTNDFAANLGLSANPVQAMADILLGEATPYDVGRFGSRYFSYVASFGAFTRSSYNVPQNIKNALGHTAYVLESIQELSQIHPEHVRIELDDRVIEDDFLFGAVSNSTSVGGILTLDPKQVDMQDGQLELLLVRSPRNLAEISECIQALRNLSYNCEILTFCPTHHARVFSDPKMVWTLDGEREPGHAVVDVRNQHLAYRLMQRR